MLENKLPGNNRLLLKLESDQPIKSFKIRGAMVAMSRNSDEFGRRGVVADSGGNHAQAVALAGRELGIPVKVIMADIVPEAKKQATRTFGATDGNFELDTSPPDFVEAKRLAMQAACEHGFYYLSPYDDEEIIRGTATLVPEVVNQLSETGLPLPDSVHVPVGGGGLISGLADVNAEQGHLFDLYGHGMTGADSAARSLHSPEPVPVEGTPNSLVEGLAVKVIGDRAHQRMKDGKIDDIYTSELRQVGLAYQWYIDHVVPQLGEDRLPEVSSMVALAGVFEHLERTGAENQTQLVIVSGGNTDLDKVRAALASVPVIPKL
jgi:threonine dehydratase